MMRSCLSLALLLILASCSPTQDAMPDEIEVAALPEPETVALPVPAPTPTPAPVPARPAPRPDITGRAEILMLGDSQISFGAGRAYRAFLSDLGSACAGLPDAFHRADAAAIGVRSSALQHWTTTRADARGVICDKDTKHGVNAGSYGVSGTGLSYVQIGADPKYPFCPAGRSALQAVFDAPAYDPDLLVLSFLGNATARLQSAATARADWAAAQAQIPDGVACMVMTTIPSFETGENTRRQRAQDNLAAAVTAGGRCSFMAGFTPATRAAFEGNKAMFRTNDAGDVIDTRHPTASSAQRFVDLQKPAFCAAIAQALTK